MAAYNDRNLGIYKQSISLTDYDGSHLAMKGRPTRNAQYFGWKLGCI